MGKPNSKTTDSEVLIAEGYDPFNGEVHLFKDGKGYWVENWRSENFSDYLKDEEGNLINSESKAIERFEAECANANFSCAVNP